MPQLPGRPQLTLAGALGEVVWLFMQSPGHRHLFLADLEWLVMPAMMLGQFRTFRSGEQIAGLALWATVSEEVEKRLTAGVVSLAPADWKSGDRLWLVELVAPFGGADAMIEDLKTSVFRGKTAKIRLTGADGKSVVADIEGRWWRGGNALDHFQPGECAARFGRSKVSFPAPTLPEPPFGRIPCVIMRARPF